MIREMQTTDLAAVIDIHLSAFQGFFLSFLGSAFLKELYDSIIQDPTGIALIEEKNSHIQGFVTGTDNPQGFYKRLLRQRGFRFAWAALSPAIRNPKSIPRLLRALSRGKGEDVHENCATLMSIAVAPEAHGKGIGQSLVQSFLQEAANRGVERVNLTTDRNNNDSANIFYQKMGFSLASTFRTPEGREMNEYLIEINAS